MSVFAQRECNASCRKRGIRTTTRCTRGRLLTLPAFWETLCEFCDVQFDRSAETTLSRPDNIMDAGWFAGSQLNYAAHLLRHTGSEAAVVFFGEDGARRELSRDALRDEVAAVAAGLRGRVSVTAIVSAVSAQLPRSGHRDAGNDEYRRNLVILLSGFRRQRGR